MSYMSIYLDAGLTLSEKLSLSGEMLLRGMGTVFMVLLILWGCLSLFKLFNTTESTAKKAEKKAESEAKSKNIQKTAAEASQTSPAAKAETKAANESANIPVAETADADDGAIIAAICAAIEAYRAEEGTYSLPYRVVSFKRKSGNKSWVGSSED